MLRDRYDPMNLFDLIPALGMVTDAVLSHLDTLLDDDVLFQAVKHDLTRRFPRTASFGRPSTPVEVILRMLVVKHLYDWSYEATEQWVSDSLVLRQFLCERPLSITAGVPTKVPSELRMHRLLVS